MVWTWMKKQGASFREVNDRQVIVFDPIGYSGETGQSIQEHVANHFVREFSPEYRAFLGEAMGLAPVDIPVTLQGLLMKGNDRLQDQDQFAGILTPRWSTNDQSSGRMLESRANYGGFVVTGQMADGIVLSPVISTHDATITWQDGSVVFVKAGTALNVINPDLFAPLPTRRPLSIGTPTLDALRGFGGRGF